MIKRKISAQIAIILCFCIVFCGCGIINTEKNKDPAEKFSSGDVDVSTNADSSLQGEDGAKNPESDEDDTMEGALDDEGSLSPANDENNDGDKDEIDAIISGMTLNEKVYQMFFVTPEVLTGVSTVTAAGNATKKAIEEKPVGGIIYQESSLKEESQTTKMLNNTKKYYEDAGYPVPFLSLDEEGGRVLRIGGNSGFDAPSIGSMSEIGKTKDPSKASDVGHTMGGYLEPLGFNMDFAPVADVLSNSSNTVIGDRSFGSDKDLVADMVVAEACALEEEGITPVIKHFPGHGATEADSHKGYAYTEKTLDELKDCELVPFQAAIDNGIDVIMASHISLPNVAETNDLPTTLSKYLLTDVLREDMGFEGVIITDAMNMGAITDTLSSDKAAVKSILAGADIILMPEDFHLAYEGVLEAVENGTISEERIDESLERILTVKMKY